MRRSPVVAKWLALAAVCLRVFLSPALAQDCPELVGVLPGSIGVVTASGGYAYLCGDCFTNGGDFHIADVSQPSAPEVVGQLEMPEIEIRHIAVQGGYAYVVGQEWPWGASLFVIDVTNPRAPRVAGRFHDQAVFSAQGVAVSGANAYVGFDTFRIVDVSNPQVPVEASSVPLMGVIEVAVAGHYAYVCSLPPMSGGVFHVIDVSDSHAPEVMGSLMICGSIAVDGRYVYLPWGPGLRVVDVSDPSNPVVIGFGDSQGTGCDDAAVSSGYAYLACGLDGLRVIDVSEPTSPVEVDFVDTADWAHGVSVSEGYVFLADGNGGLKIFRECGVFLDGFESGDTSAWSLSVP